MNKRKLTLGTALFCAIMLSSCKLGPYEYFVPKDTSPVVAKVGSVRLTLNKLDASIPPELAGTLTDEQKAAFVKQWIDAEILCQSALAEKIDKDPMVRERLESMKRSVLGAEMVNRLSIRLATDTPPSDSAIEACYNSEKARFTRPADAVRYVDIVMADRATSLAVRTAVTADNFFELGKLHSAVPLPADPAAVSFRTADQLPKEIAEVVFGIKVGGTTSPIECSDGYHIVRVLDKQKAGDILSLAEVRPELEAAVSSEMRRAQMEGLMAELRQKVGFEINLGNLSGEAGKGQ